MFVPFVALLLLVSVPLLGGKLPELVGLRLAKSYLALIALVVQVVITTFVQSGPRPVLVGLHLMTYLLAGVVLWFNRRLPGLLLIGLGSISNGVVIALNSGTLPASAAALSRAGKTPDPADFTNSGVLPHPVVPQLGDVLATPSWLPFRNVISIGDVLILLGAAVLLHVVCCSWLSPARWRSPARTPDGQPHARSGSVSVVPEPRVGTDGEAAADTPATGNSATSEP